MDANEKIMLKIDRHQLTALMERGEVSEFLEAYQIAEGSDDYELIPLDEITPETQALFLENELADANFHELAEIPRAFVRGLEEQGYSLEDQAALLNILGPLLLRNL